MPTVDLRGLSGIKGSAKEWMSGLSGPTELVQAAEAQPGAVTLRDGFSFADVTSLNAAFSDMATLQRASLAGVCAGKVDLSRAFAKDAQLESVSLTTSAAGGAVQGSATDMTEMFSGCAKLASVDLSGIGTSAIEGMVEATGTSPSGMRGMFSGCEKLVGEPGPGFNDEAHDGTVTIGQGFTRVLNGFFADRADADTAPAYILTANVVVEGGPQAASDLMVRPEYTSGGVTSI